MHCSYLLYKNLFLLNQRANDYNIANRIQSQLRGRGKGGPTWCTMIMSVFMTFY